MPGELYHVATPLLSSYAYREADLINTRPEGLLKGPASIYLDDQLVGNAELPSTASGQHMVVGFGADPQVRTRRELLTRNENLQAGNRKVSMSYRVVVANFKKQPIELRLIDRLPFAEKTSKEHGEDVTVQFAASTSELSKDGLYKRRHQSRGILRWDLEVPAERFGEKAFDVEYSFSMEFDRNHLVTAIDNLEQLQINHLEKTSYGDGAGGMGGMGGGMGGNTGNPSFGPPTSR